MEISKATAEEQLREYSRGLNHLKSPFFNYLTGLQSKPFGQWLNTLLPERSLRLSLMFHALNQGVYRSDLEGQLNRLWDVYGERIFSLNEVAFEELKGTLDSSKWKKDVSKQIPGIVRSVCDFYLRRPSPFQWLSQAESTEPIVEEISTQIFYMGKNSLQKPKTRMFLLSVLESWPEILEYAWEKDGLLPLNAETKRLLRTTKPAGFYHSHESREEEWLAYNNSIRKIFPTQSWRAYVPFSIFKRRVDRNVYACQKTAGECGGCVLNPKCWPKKY